MTEEKWEDLKNMVKNQYQVLEDKLEPLLLKTGLTADTEKKIGNKEVLVFISPAGKIKLEYIIKPVVIDKKEHYSHRAGASARTEYILSETEFVRRLEAYKWSELDSQWQKIETGGFA